MCSSFAESCTNVGNSLSRMEISSCRGMVSCQYQISELAKPSSRLVSSLQGQLHRHCRHSQMYKRAADNGDALLSLPSRWTASLLTRRMSAKLSRMAHSSRLQAMKKLQIVLSFWHHHVKRLPRPPRPPRALQLQRPQQPLTRVLQSLRVHRPKLRAGAAIVDSFISGLTGFDTKLASNPSFGTVPKLW
jgi:hypothetical protein